ncbi:hypothetical protein F4859DRAFT_516545 [Xylaria cf. heliscus]|nr:hypothetical protein F4859DRAFT_516545 [Xylaria cf. heliscus]
MESLWCPQEVIYLYNRFKYHQYVYETYYFAATQNLLEHLKASFDDRWKLDRFLADTSPDAPEVCYVSVFDDEPAPVAFRLAAQHISIQRISLRNEVQCPVIFIAPQYQPTYYEDHLNVLMRDAVTKLRPFTGGTLTVSEHDHPDTCLEAIEGIRRLSSATEYISPVFFIAGLDGAHNRHAGRQDPNDELHQAKVERLARALLRLSEKVVVCVAPNFPGLSVLFGVPDYDFVKYVEKNRFISM